MSTSNMAVDRVVANVDFAVGVPSVKELVTGVQNLSKLLMPEDIFGLLRKKLGLV